MKKLLFVFLVFLSPGCEKDIFSENYRYLYGDWVPLQITVGYGGVKPELLGDVIQIIKDGSYNVIRNEKTVETGKINIEVQTIDELSIKFVPKELDFGSNSFVRLSHYSLVVTTYNQDSIHLHSNAVDGGYFSLLLKRK